MPASQCMSVSSSGAVMQSVIGADRRPVDFTEADCRVLWRYPTRADVCQRKSTRCRWYSERSRGPVRSFHIKRHGQCVVFRFVGHTLHDGTSWPCRKDMASLSQYDTAACVVGRRNSRLDAVAVRQLLLTCSRTFAAVTARTQDADACCSTYCTPIEYVSLPALNRPIPKMSDCIGVAFS